MAELETQSIEDIMLGDGNVFAVIGRVQKALRKSGCSEDYVKHFVEKSMSDFGSYDEVLSYCMETLEEAGFRVGIRELTDDEKLLEAIKSGNYDGMSIEELKTTLNIGNGEE